MERLELTDEEFSYCADLYEERRKDLVKKGIYTKLNTIDLSRKDTIHLCATIGEFKAHQITGLPWNKFPSDRACALGTNTKVFSTQNFKGNIILDTDQDINCYYVMAIVSSNLRVVYIPGFGHGSDFQKPQYWRKNLRKPTWVIPQDELRSDWENLV